ncbi:MAG: DEAD/DEAH box helicase, partial [Pseudomonadota bacterium]
MTDTFEVQGDFAPAESINDTISFDDAPVHVIEDTAVIEDTPVVPNGFLKLGLAPELIRAIEDLGFTQPTGVQEQTIPLAMASEDEDAKFIDLMVSSQTGSGKTAAFLLPVLHT